MLKINSTNPLNYQKMKENLAHIPKVKKSNSLLSMVRDIANYPDYNPIAKLIVKDSSYLSKIELLSVILGKKDVNSVAPLMERCDNNLENLSKIPVQELAKLPGIGLYKASVIVAAFELSKRFESERRIQKESIKCSYDIFSYMASMLSDCEHEEFWILYLNHGHKVLMPVKNSQGGISSTIVDIRLILKKALEINSTVIALCHNHPSGNVKPSTEDINLTKKLKEGAGTMDITILDHVVFSGNTYYSFADEGIL